MIEDALFSIEMYTRGLCGLFQGKAFLIRPKQNGGLRHMRGECGLTKDKPVFVFYDEIS